MYLLLGICLALAAWLTINALASLLTAAIWRGLSRRARRWPAAKRARWLFALRIGPAIVALLCVAALLIPAYALYEPRQTAEAVSAKLAALALASAVGLLLAARRGLAAWLATQGLVVNWLRHARPITLEDVSIPAYRIRHSFPVIAIVGVFRPRLFIAEQIFRALNSEELSAAVAHERGHLAARDNLKRAALRACRDALAIAPCGRAMDRAWAAASEAAADEHAARAGSAVALDLAAALVKIARLAPAGIKPTLLASALLVGEDPSSIAGRVYRLTQLAEARPSREPYIASSSHLGLLLSLIISFIAVALAAFNPQLLVIVHTALERIVSTLQ